MSQDNSLQACQLVAPSKLPERLLTSGIIKQEGKLNLAENMALVYLFEVTKPWFPSSKLFSTLVETLEDAHPSLQMGDDLDSQFEFLLKNINQQLNQISESGETDWIGNLNAIIMLVAGNEIFFSQTGFCPTYLLQNNKIRQITDPGDQDKETHPLKTFSNLASGVIQDNDFLLIANTELYKEISLDALRRIMNSCSPYQTALTIGKELKKEKNTSVSSILLKVIPGPEEGAKHVVKEVKFIEPEAVYLEELMQGSFKKIQKAITPIAKRAIELSKKAGAKTQDFVANTAAPATLATFQSANKHLKSGIQKISEASKKKGPVVEIIQPSRKAAPTEVQIEIEEQVQTIPMETVPNNPIKEDLTSWYTVFAQKVKILMDKAHKKNIILLGRIKFWLKSSKNKKILAGVVGVLIIASTVVGIIKKCGPKSEVVNSNQNGQIIEEVQNQKAAISTAIELKQEIEASKLIGQANSKISSLSGLSSSEKETVSQLKYDLDQIADPLTKTLRLSALESYPFTKSGNNLMMALPYFYTFDGGTLYRTGKGDLEEAQNSISLINKDDSIISFAPTTEEDSTIGYALTKQNKVYRITQINGATTLNQIQPETDDFSVGDAIATYNGNIYILNGKSGLLWKYANTGTIYTKGVSIIDLNKYNIRGSLSIAIDGSIYLLMQDGSIQKYTSGKQDTFALTGTPELAKTMIKASQIATSPNNSSLYLLDTGATSESFSTARVLEYDKEGNYIRQYKFPKEFLKVSAIEVDQKLKKMWVLNGGQVTEFDI